MYKNKKTGMIGIIITIVVLILVVILSNIDLQEIPYMENIFSSIVMPIQNGLTHLKNKIAGNDSFFTDIETLKQENEELKKKNSELEQSLRELEIIKAENRKDFVSHDLEYYEKLYDIYNKDNNMYLFLGKVNLDKIIKILNKDKKEITEELKQYEDKEKLGKSANTKRKELNKRLDKINTDIKNYKEKQKEYGNEIILNAHVILKYGNKAWVVYAGNHNILTETYSNYLTYQYHIEYCHKNGVKMYDQFGTVKDCEDKRYKGLHEFKKKFGGDYVEFCGEYDYITNKPMYFIFTKLVPLYRSIVRN